MAPVRLQQYLALVEQAFTAAVESDLRQSAALGNDCDAARINPVFGQFSYYDPSLPVISNSAVQADLEA